MGQPRRTLRWDQVCVGCGRRLPMGWQLSPFGPGRHLLLREFSGRGRIRTIESLDLRDREAQPFRQAWIRRLRAVLAYLEGSGSNGRWIVPTAAFIPRVVEEYARSPIPEPNVSATGRWTP